MKSRSESVPAAVEVRKALLYVALSAAWYFAPVSMVQGSTDTAQELRIEVAGKGAGKQVVISQEAKEWFMLVDVTPENTVILKQEKDQDRYVVDESETHDRPMTADEVDAAITDYVNSVKTRARKK
ncbi:hypothetical protein [Candidatus Nitrospira nitrificans]|uniref:Uncharacterized protein n=1 Tax=Candidatus Nitrospira nitrificans TaxID=1742973 RepID=A0A0S4LIH8_9BACT|nr:hypothetical protein [Candidatus Nitrospira nitrificans]CUS36477.1 conserved hypothetical protein [Candidatus Nitrospira nitrificans]